MQPDPNTEHQREIDRLFAEIAQRQARLWVLVRPTQDEASNAADATTLGDRAGCSDFVSLDESGTPIPEGQTIEQAGSDPMWLVLLAQVVQRRREEGARQ